MKTKKSLIFSFAVASLSMATCSAFAGADLSEFTISFWGRAKELPTDSTRDVRVSFPFGGENAFDIFWNPQGVYPNRQLWPRFQTVDPATGGKIFAYAHQRDTSDIRAGDWNHYAVTYSCASQMMTIVINGYLRTDREFGTSPKRPKLVPLKPFLDVPEAAKAPIPGDGTMAGLKLVQRALTVEDVRAAEPLIARRLAGDAAFMRPEPPAAKGRGFLWGAVDPTDREAVYLPQFSIPEAALFKPIEVTAARGEVEPGSVLVRSRKALKGLCPSVGTLVSESGATLPPETVDFRGLVVTVNAAVLPRVHAARMLKPNFLLHDVGMVRTDLERMRTYLRLETEKGSEWRDISDDPGIDYIDYQWHKKHNWSNMFVSAAEWPIRDAKAIRPFDLPANFLQQYWLTVRVPTDAKPGVYRADIAFRTADGKTADKVPFALTVLPFALPDPKTAFDLSKTYHTVLYYRLEDPDVTNTLSAGSISPRGRNERQIRADLENIRDHGIEAPTVAFHLPLPCWKPQRGGYAYFPTAEERAVTVKVLKMMKAAGFPMKPIYVTNGCNFGFRHGYEEEKHRALLERMVEESRSLFIEALGHFDVQFYGMDEARGKDIEGQHAYWALQRKLGAKLYTTCWSKDVAAIAGHVDTVVPSSMPFREVADIAHAKGSDILNYASPQSGFHETACEYRRGYGFGIYCCNYDGFSVYCWNETGGVPWNAYHYRSGQAYVFAYQTADGVVDTPSWEGIREAVDDVRYATALRQLGDTESNAWLNALNAYQPGFDCTAVRKEVIRRILAVSRSKCK